MKIRPKVPVCTDCDHVFEYRGRNPGQLGGVVVQFGEAYCTKKKKPRLTETLAQYAPRSGLVQEAHPAEPGAHL